MFWSSSASVGAPSAGGWAYCGGFLVVERRPQCVERVSDCGLSCPVAYGIFLEQVSKLMSPVIGKLNFFHHFPGKSHQIFFIHYFPKVLCPILICLLPSTSGAKLSS